MTSLRIMKAMKRPGASRKNDMAVLWLKGGVPSITPLPDAVIELLLRRIKPIKNIDGRLHELSTEGVALWTTAFMWDPKIVGPVAGNLYELAFVETYHTCGYIGLFKPSLGEVISQIPSHLVDDVSHFEIEIGDTVGCYSDGDGHRTMTRLYTRFSTNELIERALARHKS